MTTLQIIFLLLVVALILIIVNLIWMVSKIINNAIEFTYAVNENLTRSQLQSEMFKTFKYQTYKNLRKMKKLIFVGILGIMTVVVSLTFIGCKAVENGNASKLKTEMQATIDSLQTEFTVLKAHTDSLQTVNDSLLTKIEASQKYSDYLKKEVNRLRESNKNLTNVVKQQNTMIQKLQDNK